MTAIRVLAITWIGFVGFGAGCTNIPGEDETESVEAAIFLNAAWACAAPTTCPPCLYHLGPGCLVGGVCKAPPPPTGCVIAE